MNNKKDRVFLRLLIVTVTGVTTQRLFLRQILVGARGFEPPASASRTLRAAICATPRFIDDIRARLYDITLRKIHKNPR